MSFAIKLDEKEQPSFTSDTAFSILMKHKSDPSVLEDFLLHSFKLAKLALRIPYL